MCRWPQSCGASTSFGRRVRCHRLLGSRTDLPIRVQISLAADVDKRLQVSTRRKGRESYGLGFISLTCTYLIPGKLPSPYLGIYDLSPRNRGD